MKTEFHIIGLIEVKVISWKIEIIMKFCFDIVRFKKINENILMFQTYVNLIVINNVEQQGDFVC